MSSTAPADEPRLPPHLRPGRRASWFELFFDLAFVVAVSQLTAALSHHFDAIGFAQFVLLLLLLWWTWLGHTFHATRFDEDRFDQHLLGLLQIAAVVVIAYGAGGAFADRATAFVWGMAVLKLLLGVAYLRELGRPGARALARTYAGVYAAQALLWLTSMLLPWPARWFSWAAVLALDIASPRLVARHTHGYPPHPEHLPERFGLFTIIVMGESIAAVAHGLLHAGALSIESGVPAALGLALAFLYWIGYYERTGAQHELHVRNAQEARRLRRWAYGHVPLLVGVAGGAGGLIAAIGNAAGTAAPVLMALCIALAMIGLTLIGEARRAGAARATRERGVHLMLAVLPLLAALSGAASWVLLLGVATSAAQIAVSRSRAA